MSISKCVVRLKDDRGVEHRGTVEARSPYEAVCKAWPKFAWNNAPTVEDVRGLKISVEQIPRSFQVNLEKLFRHVSSAGDSPKDHLNRARLLLRGEGQ